MEGSTQLLSGRVSFNVERQVSPTWLAASEGGSFSTDRQTSPPAVQQEALPVQILKQITVKRVLLLIGGILVPLLLESVWKPAFNVPEEKRWQPYFVISSLVAAIALIIDDLPADCLLLSVAVIYILTGIITEEEAFAGFGNGGVVTYAGLFAVSTAFQETAVLEPILGAVLGSPKSFLEAQLRLCVPVCMLSAFFNNGPVVAMVVPVIEGWAQRCGIPASQLMMPLAYASTLGGTLTVVGGAANLVAASITKKLDPPVHIACFDLTPLGSVASLAGLAYIILLAPILLPDNSRLTEGGEETPSSTPSVTPHTSMGQLPVLMTPSESMADLEGMARDNGPPVYDMFFVIRSRSSMVGKSLSDTGVPRIPGVTVLSVRRGGVRLSVVDGLTSKLMVGDMVAVTSTAAGVQEMRSLGLTPSMHKELARLGARRRRRQLVEAVVSCTSTLLDNPLDVKQLARQAGAAVLAVRRDAPGGDQSVCLPSYAGFQLQAGDVLLCEAFFEKLVAQRQDFSLCAAVSGTRPPRTGRKTDAARGYGCLLLFLAIVFMSALDWAPLAPMVLAMVVLCSVSKVYDWSEARQAVNGSVMITIAASFALSTAMKKSGAAAAIASGVVSVGMGGGQLGVLCAMYLATATLSNIISNTATAVMMIPIAVSVAHGLATPDGEAPDVKSFLLVIIMAANAAFSTPIATPCNMLVVEPGMYRFADFLKFGLPLQIWLALVTCSAAYAMG
eukprot:TRINITY_DN20905_c0_g1_i1.p1 TRINITY_DN20905_c0_g1~~TRINITY_DN20905_c0_g1_i1.p1  ORF type:complete len:730 (-),score=126.25 TRINITY_DN20905_c0_g1_i1:131-2320(-)